METFDTKIASLMYLTNPLYQGILKQKNQPKAETKKADIKFYRKRISALTKDMLKGDIPDNTFIKTLYETYVNGLVNYFKMIDTNDIIQQQYGAATVEGSFDATVEGSLDAAVEGSLDATVEGSLDATLEGSLDAAVEGSLDAAVEGSLEAGDINLENMNDCLIRKHASINTLDNFVIKKNTTENDIRIIPVILDVDLTNPTLKTKGVKDKGGKGKSKKEQQSKIEQTNENTHLETDIILVKKNI